jgi:hypothetical protein
VTQKDVFPGTGSQSGLGDSWQSFFVSPQKVNARGVDWGLDWAESPESGPKGWGFSFTATLLFPK